jgi:hypothetical protein
MEVLDALRQALKAAADVIKWGAGIQESTRKALVADMQGICGNIETAYETVLTRLVPIKNAYSDPAKLAVELRTFAADAATRRQFKPEHLCGQVDVLMGRLSSTLDPLKYSIDFRRIEGLRQYLSQFGNVDGAIFESYDEFTNDLDQLATQMQDPQYDPQERALYVRHVVDDFMEELRSAQADMRDAKAKVVSSI